LIQVNQPTGDGKETGREIMSTPSHIVARRSDGKYARIDCHLDGYLSHNGRILIENYQSQDKIDQLMALGHLRSLGAEIGKKHTLDSPHRQDVCDAYRRDGGQIGTEAVVGDALSSVWPRDAREVYTYLWDGSEWLVRPKGSQTLVSLKETLDPPR
jgi:hypothetical protein